MLRLSLALSGLLVLAAATSGCVVHGRTRVGYAAHVSAEPALVEVSPGVMVIEDYHEPVFYSDGFYWRYYGGIWYRSSYHTGGWVTWSRPPSRIVGIRRPHAYVRYRGHAGVRRTHIRGRTHHRGRDGRVIHDHRRDGRHHSPGPDQRDRRRRRNDR